LLSLTTAKGPTGTAERERNLRAVDRAPREIFGVALDAEVFAPRAVRRQPTGIGVRSRSDEGRRRVAVHDTRPFGFELLDRSVHQVGQHL
jgi:hypothetical protein